MRAMIGSVSVGFSVFCGGTLSAAPMPPALTETAPRLAVIRIAGEQLNSGNVAVVTFPGGRYVHIGGDRWMELGDNGERIDFVESGYDETVVYLFDAARNVQIGLDISGKVVLYAEGTQAFRPIYTITGAEMGRGAGGAASPQAQGDQAGAQTVSYSCNEGIPLIVRYETTPAGTTAFASHDGFPEVRLEQVPSGSGARFAGGTYELHTKGASAIFMFDGNEDACTQD